MSFFQKLRPISLPIDYNGLDKSDKFIVREMYIEQQKGLCYHCCGDLKSPPPQDVLEKRVHSELFPHGFFDRPIHLHHSHKTGLTIGVVHAYCNAVLWEHYGE